MKKGLLIVAAIVVVTSIVAHLESGHSFFGSYSGAIFWLTAIVGTTAVVIAGFGAVKMLEDKKDLEYKFSQR